ncbi:MAG: septation protein SepH, partial [Kineosporiaceae bacterium]
MDDLTLVGVHDDGEHLVLGGAGGQRFRIRLDDALRAAVRRDRARLGQLQLESNGGLRPREIQARIRSGQTAEEIAEAAGIPVDHVRRYEGPVLAEREFIATQARGVRLRRSGPGGTATLTLGDLVLQRLDRQDADDHDLTWDAWRDEDGHWVVCLSYGTDDPRNRAHWTYQPQDRSLQPRDDRARRLSDDEPVEAGPLTQRRLQQIRRTSGDRVYDIEADGGPGDGGPGEVRRATVDLLDTLRERRGRRQRLSSPDEEPDTGSGDDVDSAVETLRSRAEALGNPPAAHPPRSRPERASDADVLQLPEEEPLRIPEDEDLIRHRTTARPPAARRGGPPAPAERTDRG